MHLLVGGKGIVDRLLGKSAAAAKSIKLSRKQDVVKDEQHMPSTLDKSEFAVAAICSGRFSQID
jgi:hypothetical protein